MGIWLELGLFAVIIAAALWQLRDVNQAIADRKRSEGRRIIPKAAPPTGHPQPDGPAADSKKVASTPEGAGGRE